MRPWQSGLAVGVALGVAAAGLAAREPDPMVAPEPRLVTGAGYRLSPADPHAVPQIERGDAWVASGAVPGRGTRWEDMSRWALIDLYQLTSGEGAPPAGAGDRWGYFWPRDGAFVAVALHRTGHEAEAREIVDFVASLPFDAEAGFDARYLLSGDRVRDRPRGPQSDGCGWVLWALGELTDQAGMPLGDVAAESVRDRCVANLLDLTDYGSRLPPASPDYWEVPVGSTSLGTVAPMVAGLAAAQRDYVALGRGVEAARVGDAAGRLLGVVQRRFGPAYERFGAWGGLDAAVAMLMPPFAREDRGVVGRWRDYQREARRVSGGLAPGVAWKGDGTSWTPETALVAYTAAASGRRSTAQAWLDWLDAHRTPWGSLPEKVTRSGRPAGPAPLLWTGSLVLLTLLELEEDAAV